ncbi:MAG TPA: 3-hydroxyacyl-ACP dehydratase FabZ family protein [Bauldia sp.]|nr:3-hydroxyacyl-ACP dehydratase FabZ family protein [Bauldia sp.]
MRLEYFDLIDKVDELDLEGSTIRVSARLPEKSPIFDGHFPNFPILPGVMMLEVMNHAAGYLLYRRFKGERFVFLGGVKRAKFRRMVKPGDAIEARAHLTHEGSGFSVAETTLTCGGATAADAEIILISQAFPNAEIKAALAKHSEMLVAPAEA